VFFAVLCYTQDKPARYKLLNLLCMIYNVLSWSLQSYLFHFTVEEAEVPPVQENEVLSTHTSEWVQPSLKTKEKFSIVDVRPCYYYSFCLPMSRNISISLIWCKLLWVVLHCLNWDYSLSIFRRVLSLYSEFTISGSVLMNMPNLTEIFEKKYAHLQDMLC
jgi:hypothetical protein